MVDLISAEVPRLELRNLSKLFGANRVLTDVSLKFLPGSVHALLGANGSGKSTIIKILAGYHEPSGGEILVNGQSVSLPLNNKQIHAAGVRFVHQDLGLIPNMSVGDNLGLGTFFERRGGRISWKAQNQRSRQMLAVVGLHDVDPETLIQDLGPVQCTLVAIARAIDGLEPATGVLVLDEPTARLPNAQVAELLARCRELRSSGLALIYVSHRLDEIFNLADEVTVLRDGRVIFDDQVSATSMPHLTSLISGSKPGDQMAPAMASSPGAPGPVFLNVDALSGNRVRDASFTVCRGEIVALTGLIGSGRSELGRLIFGSQKESSGTVSLDGSLYSDRSPARSLSLGIGYVPQDRKQAGFGNMDLVENVTLIHVEDFISGWGLSKRKRLASAERWIQELDVRPPEPGRFLEQLSGGNQQKVVLAKWLALDLKLLILDEPAYGVDVGARKRILGAVVDRARSSGLAVLLIDSDIDLVAEYADRVLVMREGLIVDHVQGTNISTERIASASFSNFGPMKDATPDDF